ncbi:MAG: hypothetical protein MUF13_15900, partial [Akkermansiaceae bacterium]|nr:hypothetical protein [Akkermansiaceae bacterium]
MNDTPKSATISAHLVANIRVPFWIKGESRNISKADANTESKNEYTRTGGGATPIANSAISTQI